MFNNQRYHHVDGSIRRSGGAVEHSQTAILEINSSQHHAVLKERTTTSTSSSMQRHGHPSNVGPAAENWRASSSSLLNTNSTEHSPLLTPQQSPYNHNNNNNGASMMRSVPSLLEIYNNGFYNNSSYALGQNMSIGEESTSNTIRFQVVVWHIGAIDLIQARVPITFRLTMFWNSLSDADDLDGPPDCGSASQKSQQTLRMLGRQKAFYCDKTIPETTIEVPAVSILNVVTFDTIGDAEVTVLNEESRLLRWSCMYRATLFQQHWEVRDFPHDQHEISLRLAVLAQRQPGAAWDRNVWKLHLATADDAQGSVRAPEGLVVDHVSIPGFLYNPTEGLQFEFQPLNHGPGGGAANDTCLVVKLRVLRNSSYYDRNIIPLLAMLNFVAISITFLEAQRFFERGLLTLNIVSELGAIAVF